MKKIPRVKTVIFGVAVLLVSLLIAENLVVKVQSTFLRKEPKFYAATVATLRAGESVTKIATQGDWHKVRTASGVEGWLHASAVSKKQVNVAAMDKSLQTKASAEEVALASKGFNEQVEKEYKAKHKEVNFAWVDRMLKITVSPDQLRRFLQEGRLAEFGGGQ